MTDNLNKKNCNKLIELLIAVNAAEFSYCLSQFHPTALVQFNLILADAMLTKIMLTNDPRKEELH